MTIDTVLMVVSIALQLVVVVLALRLIPITGRRSAWVLLAAAAALMAVRRILLVVGEALGDESVVGVSDASTIIISVLMIVGIARIEPIFRSWRRSEATIRETEARYQKLVDSARDAIVTTDAEGRIVSANPATAAMLGFASTAEILGRHAAEFYVDQQERELAVDRLRTTGFVQNYEARLARPESPSRVVHVLANATLRRDDQRRVTGTEIIFTDITDWKLAEEARRQSESRLRAILDNSQTIVTLVDARGTILFESLAVTSVLGYAPEELIGRSTFDFIHPDDTLGAAERFRAVGHHPDAAGNMRFRFRHKDGTWRHLEAFGRNLLHDSAIAAILVNSRDVSDRVQADEALRHSEEFHRTLLEQSFDGILVLGPDLNVKYRSPSIARMMGRPAEARVGNALWRDDLHPADYAHVAAAEAQLRANPGTPVQMKIRVRRADGEYRLLEVQVVNQLHDPTVRGIVANFRDVTDEARLQEQLQRAQKMEGVGRLAGGVAHDFNNLLTVVLGAASLGLESAPRGSELRDHLQNILDYGRRAGALTRRLLTFARRTAIEPKIVDLNVLIEDARKLVGSLIGEDISVVMRAAQGLWPVKADPVQIEQVLVNLSVNARDAMPDGGTLTFETRNVTVAAGETARHAIRPGDYAVLTIADTGVGMDAETRSHLFEPFFSTKGEQGTGLGLATCYGIVTQHGGMIACDSQAGAGASFHVYLPRSVETSGDAAVIPDAMRGRGERILVVEDEPLVLNVAVQSLRRYGYEVVPASGGADALAAMEARGDEIDLVVTDIVMPGMSGQALGDSLRPRWPELKIIFTSGYSENLPVNPSSLPRGAAFLAKPYTPSALAEKVREALDSR